MPLQVIACTAACICSSATDVHKLSYGAPPQSATESANGQYSMHYAMTAAQSKDPSTPLAGGSGRLICTYKMLASDGAILWTRQSEHRVWDAAAMDDGSACVLSSSPRETPDGDLRWTLEFPAGNHIEYFDRSGDISWTMTLRDLDPLAVSLHALYVSETYSQAYALLKSHAQVLGPTEYDTHVIRIPLRAGFPHDLGAIDNLLREFGANCLATDLEVSTLEDRGFVWARMRLSKKSFEGVEDGVQWRDNAPAVFTDDGCDYALKLVLAGFDSVDGKALELLWESDFLGRCDDPTERQEGDAKQASRLELRASAETGELQALMRDDAYGEAVVVRFDPSAENVLEVTYR